MAALAMIVTLKIKLESWGCDIELEDDSTLEELHHAIQFAVDFDDDHLYEFFAARHRRARNRIDYDYETKIRDLFPLPHKAQLFYLFDFGDCWLFKIVKSRKKLHSTIEGIEYPRVVNETGEKPIQYDLEEF